MEPRRLAVKARLGATPAAPPRAVPSFDDEVIIDASVRREAQSRVGSRLPYEIDDVERIAPGVICVRGSNPSYETGPGTNTYLVGTGAARVLIDTADGNERGADGSNAGGLNWVLGTWPEASKRPCALGDGEICADVPGVALRGVHSPGHCNEHACYELTSHDGGLFTGDLMLGEGTVMILAPPHGSMDDYLASLLRVRLMRPPAIFPGHGHSVRGTALCCAFTEAYYRVRVAREAQILSMLAAGAGTADDVVSALYSNRPGFTREMRAAATTTTNATLHRLHRLGACARGSHGRWRPA
ncbi:hydroxyacylglutathione hydrolase [Aureococcus anophagefferens]|nr:hydroxyacylglutathione hydrolase [Aureococcus anophagefferens]